MARSSARGRRWDSFREAIFRLRGRVCQRCGRPGRLEVHHVVPVESGGAMLDPANVVILCRGCHIDHHRNDRGLPERSEWRQLIAEA